MRREIRDMSGFEHSEEAARVLDRVPLTAKQIAAFYEELSQRQHATLDGVSGYFLLRGNEVRYVPMMNSHIASLYKA